MDGTFYRVEDADIPEGNDTVFVQVSLGYLNVSQSNTTPVHVCTCTVALQYTLNCIFGICFIFTFMKLLIVQVCAFNGAGVGKWSSPRILGMLLMATH